MINELKRLSEELSSFSEEASGLIAKIAARYEKQIVSMPEESQDAYKYVMYLKLMRGISDSEFYALKRKYIDTGPGIQEECRKELDTLVLEDAGNTEFSSTEIRKRFNELLNAAER